MRLSEFWDLIDHVFGPQYSRTLAREMHLTGLDSRTCMVALDDGVDPRDVWHALCDQMQIPPDARDGGDPDKLVPPAR